MPTVSESDGEVRVLTFKQGLLSAVAHDLELALERFHIEWDEERVMATFDLRSLRVLHALLGGEPSPGTLSARDLQRIDDTIARDVLDTKRYPEARFESSSVTTTRDTYVVRGTLTLAGRARELCAEVRRKGARYETELELDQVRWGITPYRAMMGTLQVKPEVRVRVGVVPRST